MPDNTFQEPDQYVNKPYTEAELEQKVSSIQADLAKKLDSWAGKIHVSMSPRPAEIKREEGETWTDNRGKKWIRKDNINQTVTNLDDAKMPLFCPRCSLSMTHRFDRKFYYIRGFCYNCNIEEEGKMRIAGTYDLYEKKIMLANERDWLKDQIQIHMDYIKNFTTPKIYFESGVGKNTSISWEELATKKEFLDILAKVEQSMDMMIARLEQIKEEELAEESIQSEEILNK